MKDVMQIVMKDFILKQKAIIRTIALLNVKKTILIIQMEYMNALMDVMKIIHI